MARFTRQLAFTQDGGITIVRGLELLAQRPHPLALRRIAAELAGCMRRGATFAQAADWERGRLPEFFVTMVSVGERTGTLHTVIALLARYYEDVLELRGKLIEQITYPAGVLAGIWVGIPMVLYVILSISEGGDEWAFLFGLLGVFLRHSLPLVPPVVLFLVLARISVLRRVALHALFFFRTVRNLAIARFAWSMELLMHAGLALPQAIPLAAATTELIPIERSLRRIVPGLEEGMTLAEATSGVRWLPEQTKAAIAVGEESGALVETFAGIARDHYGRAMHMMRSGVTVVEAILIIALGLMVLRMVI